MKKIILTIATAVIANFTWAQPTTYGVGAGVGGNANNSYYGISAGANNTATSNTFIGAGSGTTNTIGTNNTFLGSSSGYFNTASFNTFLGSISGINNTTGEFNTFVGAGSGSTNSSGASNTFVGQNTGSFNTSGSFNTFVGRLSGRDNTTGESNVFLGSESGESNLSGVENVFIGRASGINNISGDSNTFIGRSSGFFNTTGSLNTFVGHTSGNNNTTGSSNSFLGTESGHNNTIGADNVFVGARSGFGNTSGGNSTFLGAYSGTNNSTGMSNTFIGRGSGSFNTTGGHNTYVGQESGATNINGSGNVFLGYRAGSLETGSNLLYIDNSNTTQPLIWGDFSTDVLKVNGTLGVGLPLGVNPTESVDVIGTARLRGVTQDDTQTRVLVTDVNGSVRWREANSLAVAVGDNLGDHTATQSITANADALYDIGSIAGSFADLYLEGSLYLGDVEFLHNGNGIASVALGLNTLPAVVGGNSNVAIGFSSASDVTTGIRNVAVGRDALNFITTGSSNTAIGYDAGPGNAFQSGFSNSTAIGNQARNTASNQARIGNSNVTNIGGYALWTNLSDIRFKENIENDNVPGLKFINELKTVTYEVNRKKLGEFLNEETTDNSPIVKSKREAGLIAQEVEEVVANGKYAFAGVYKPENENYDTYGLRYESFVAPLIKAVQELSAEITALREEINTLKSNQPLDANARTYSSAPAETVSNTSMEKGVKLEQNHPNPFDVSTTIRMNIPDEVKSAFVTIFDLRGEQILSQVIQGKGATTMQIEAKKLKPGMYLYSLVVNGEIVDTKRMLVTE